MGIKTHAVAMETKNHQKNKTPDNTESSILNRFSLSLHQNVYFFSFYLKKILKRIFSGVKYTANRRKDDF